jgi:hypothetical protein
MRSVVVFEQATVYAPGFDGFLLEQAWRAPDGTLIGQEDATALAPTDPQTDPWQWLVDRGYETVQLGITAETAAGWEPLEIAGTTLLGLVLTGGAVAVVDRRRPT